MKRIIEVKDLNVFFPSGDSKNNIHIIRGVDFDVYENQIIGFIGESGSGKSVTAKSLLGINNNAITKAKKLDIDGVDMLTPKNVLTTKKHQWKKIRGKKIAYIPQDSLTSLNPTKKVGKQITEALKLHSTTEKNHAERKLEAIRILENFGIKNAKNKINLYPHQFSGGMRQRVVIAIMIACRPNVLIADEPTTALDPTVQSSVLALFEKIVETTNTAIIFISHDIAVIASLCDYIYIYYAGRVVEKGTREDIFTDPKHPYTWSLLSAIPDEAINPKGQKLYTIPGQPPSFNNLPIGDPFAVRNPNAMKIDFQAEPPLFKVSDTHYAATWLLHPSAKEVVIPRAVTKLVEITKKGFKNVKKYSRG